MVCPECGINNNALTAIEPGVTPSEGDLALCFNCGCITQYDKNLDSIPITEEGLAEVKKLSLESYIMVTKASEFIKSKRK